MCMCVCVRVQLQQQQKALEMLACIKKKIETQHRGTHFLLSLAPTHQKRHCMCVRVGSGGDRPLLILFMRHPLWSLSCADFDTSRMMCYRCTFPLMFRRPSESTAVCVCVSTVFFSFCSTITPSSSYPSISLVPTHSSTTARRGVQKKAET